MMSLFFVITKPQKGQYGEMNSILTRCGFETGVKNVFLNSVIKTTSKLIQSDQWATLDETVLMTIYNQVS